MVESKESLQGKKQGRKKGRRREKRCPSSDRSVERRYALLNGSCRIQEQRESWQGFSNDSTAFVDVSKGTIRNLSERLIQGKNTEGDARRFASVPRLIKVGKEVFGAVRYGSRDSSYPIESKSVRIQGTTRYLVFENAFPLEKIFWQTSLMFRLIYSMH